MIFITGDTHGNFDKLCFLANSMDDYEKAQENYLIICGDFGGIWTGTEEERADLEKELCYTDLKELTPVILREFISAIYVSESDCFDRPAQRLSIIYNFIGQIKTEEMQAA